MCVNFTENCLNVNHIENKENMAGHYSIEYSRQSIVCVVKLKAAIVECCSENYF